MLVNYVWNMRVTFVWFCSYSAGMFKKIILGFLNVWENILIAFHIEDDNKKQGCIAPQTYLHDWG